MHYEESHTDKAGLPLFQREGVPERLSVILRRCLQAVRLDGFFGIHRHLFRMLHHSFATWCRRGSVLL